MSNMYFPSFRTNGNREVPWLIIQPPGIPSYYSFPDLIDAIEMAEQNFQVPAFTLEGSSILTQDQQSRALKNLRKEVYNPFPKKMINRVSSYYRGRSKNILYEERGDEDKRCAVCLEDFEPREWVMLTPCDHMFHEECIVPWAKSHGRCPVCRFALYGPGRGNEAPSNPNGFRNVVPPNNYRVRNVAAGEDLAASVVSAVEFFARGNTARQRSRVL